MRNFFNKWWDKAKIGAVDASDIHFCVPVSAVNGGVWKKAGELKKGQFIATIGANGEPVYERIVSIDPVAEEDVYDIEVDGTHNFVGNGIVAHNTAFFQQASTTLFSANQAWFGGSATTTIDSAGNLSVAGTLGVTGNTTLANATTTNFFATVTFDYTAGSVQTWTSTGSTVTIATSNWPPTGHLGVLLLIGTNAGAYTLTMPTVTWLKPDGTTTTTFATYLAANTGRTALQTSGVDQILLWSRDAGTTIYGKLV